MSDDRAPDLGETDRWRARYWPEVSDDPEDGYRPSAVLLALAGLLVILTGLAALAEALSR